MIEQDANRDREEALRAEDEATTHRVEDFTPEKLLQLTKTPLYRAKRARAGREILPIGLLRLVNLVSKTRPLPSTALNGAQAAEETLLGNKHDGIDRPRRGGTLNPPAGRKVVCLLMMSPKIINDYRGRYEGTVIVIASQMAGRPITEDPSRVFLGTTGLYTDHSSHYNRVRLPQGTL